MFKQLTRDEVAAFRPIYHQTTPWPNPIIESILYDDAKRALGTVHCFGDVLDGNYIITHRSGFTYVHFNPDGIGIGAGFSKSVDEYMQVNEAFSHYLMFYVMPPALLEHLKAQSKEHFNMRSRRKYRIDVAHFNRMDQRIHVVPEGHRLVSLVEAGTDVLAGMQHKLDSRFYNSWNDFLDNSFGFVLFNAEGAAVALAYTMCTVGRIADVDLVTLPEHRKKGYGAMIITHLVRECHRRHLEAHWDCFVSNHTDKLVREVYGVERVYLSYDMVTYLNRPNPA